MKKYPGRFLLALLMVTLIAGCAVTPSPSQAQKEKVDQPVLVSSNQLPAPAPAPTPEQVYVARAGDTLTAIGRRFGVTSQQLQSRNGIADPRSLKIGARLVIPNQQQRVSHASKVPPANKQWTRFIWPLKDLEVSSEFGTRNGRHKGIDLRAPRGTNVYAAADGVVHFVGRQRGYGKVVILKHSDNIKTYYAHNEKNMVSKGQQIRQGELIARVGRTGNASGDHLHFEYVQGRRRLNPRDYIGK